MLNMFVCCTLNLCTSGKENAIISDVDEVVTNYVCKTLNIEPEDIQSTMNMSLQTKRVTENSVVLKVFAFDENDTALFYQICKKQ